MYLFNETSTIFMCQFVLYCEEVGNLLYCRCCLVTILEGITSFKSRLTTICVSSGKVDVFYFIF